AGAARPCRSRTHHVHDTHIQALEKFMIRARLDGRFDLLQQLQLWRAAHALVVATVRTALLFVSSAGGGEVTLARAEHRSGTICEGWVLRRPKETTASGNRKRRQAATSGGKSASNKPNHAHIQRTHRTHAHTQRTHTRTHTAHTSHTRTRTHTH